MMTGNFEKKLPKSGPRGTEKQGGSDPHSNLKRSIAEGVCQRDQFIYTAFSAR
jgi:hypothetical protein